MLLEIFGFNPVLGFLSAATLARTGLYNLRDVFQSRVGFSLRRDSVTPEPADQRDKVSIPCWVFSPPRPGRRGMGVVGTRRFNPVLGFFSAATQPDGHH